jgi:hypothetical protein
VNSISDLFHDGVPSSFIANAFPNHAGHAASHGEGSLCLYRMRDKGIGRGTLPNRECAGPSAAEPSERLRARKVFRARHRRVASATCISVISWIAPRPPVWFGVFQSETR